MAQWLVLCEWSKLVARHFLTCWVTNNFSTKICATDVYCARISFTDSFMYFTNPSLSLCILNVGTRRRRVSWTPRIFTPWKGPPLPTEYEAGWVSERVWSIQGKHYLLFTYLFWSLFTGKNDTEWENTEE